MKNIPFNIPLRTNNEIKYISSVLESGEFSGDGLFTKKCHKWFEDYLEESKVLLTTSCTHALEMVAILLDIKDGDEIIMPSFTFVSTANAFILRGAKIIFVDVRPDTMNIDESKIEQAITKKTKAIVPVHYAGVACEMDLIMSIANRHGLYVVEDAAQGMMSKYKGKNLGTIGHFGVYSFHETKNYNCGEGGLLIINDENFKERAEIIREKGTNRTKFLNGIIEKYTWVDIGSSYLPSELNAAFLYAQLEFSEKVNIKRLKLWNRYFFNLKGIRELQLPHISDDINHNGHLFFIKVKNIAQRQDLMNYLSLISINTAFHYVPLSESDKCNAHFEFRGDNKFTTLESERLLRLPIYYDLEIEDIDHVCEKITDFFND